MVQNDRSRAIELRKGAYDLHTHPLPSHFSRALDDLELVREADRAGMAGVMIKNHYEPTEARAALINRISGVSARAYGGIVLNWPAGGLNPYAAESALKMGAKIVWMPTRDSRNCLRYGKMEGDFFDRPGIAVLDCGGKLKPEVYEIFEVVKKYGAFLATGHLSPRESLLLCRAGRGQKVKMILTHPEWRRTAVPLEQQVELAGLGVLVEKNWLNIAEGDTTAEAMACHIRAIGSERVYLATDRGQAGFEHPAEGMLRFIQSMLEQGISDREIRNMVTAVPRIIVGE